MASVPECRYSQSAPGSPVSAQPIIMAKPAQTASYVAKPLTYIPASIMTSQPTSHAIHVVQQVPTVTMVQVLTTPTNSANGYITTNQRPTGELHGTVIDCVSARGAKEEVNTITFPTMPILPTASRVIQTVTNPLSQGVPGQKLTLLQSATPLSLMQNPPSLNMSGREMTTASLAGSVYAVSNPLQLLATQASTSLPVAVSNVFDQDKHNEPYPKKARLEESCAVQAEVITSTQADGTGE